MLTNLVPVRFGDPVAFEECQLPSQSIEPDVEPFFTRHRPRTWNLGSQIDMSKSLYRTMYMHASRFWTAVSGNFALDEYSCRLIIADSRPLSLISIKVAFLPRRKRCLHSLRLGLKHKSQISPGDLISRGAHFCCATSRPRQMPACKPFASLLVRCRFGSSVPATPWVRQPEKDDRSARLTWRPCCKQHGLSFRATCTLPGRLARTRGCGMTRPRFSPRLDKPSATIRIGQRRDMPPSISDIRSDQSRRMRRLHAAAL
ncbi:hypothetical protein BDV97DRAFT_406313 [Delphinella strobiligena]|nr:hypothetical protein BDV97DRAFT_406313 [Delphinella strobiligena]